MSYIRGYVLNGNYFFRSNLNDDTTKQECEPGNNSQLYNVFTYFCKHLIWPVISCRQIIPRIILDFVAYSSQGSHTGQFSAIEERMAAWQDNVISIMLRQGYYQSLFSINNLISRLLMSPL